MSTKALNLPRTVSLGDGACEQISDCVSGPGRAVMVAGQRAHDAAGAMVESALSEAGFTTHVIKPGFDYDQDVDVAAGVGGGSCIDRAKQLGQKQNARVLSIPTVLSHDGIASNRIVGEPGSPSREGPMPHGVFVDTTVIAGAPQSLNAAGFGDAIANQTALYDWRASHDRTGEYISLYAEKQSQLTVDIAREQARGIGQNDPDALRNLAKALLNSGIAMTVAGSSRPASGGEHLLSHALDSLDSPALHGHQVGLGAIICAYRHGQDWKNLRDLLQKANCPVTAEQAGIEGELFVRALQKASTIRDDRYTILNDLDDPEAVAHETGVVR